MSKLPYRELQVWQTAMDTAVEVAGLSQGWPRYLQDQTCRAAFSIAANVAEGNGRSTPLDYASFVDRARGSLFELDTWLLGAARLGLLPDDKHESLQSCLEDLSVRLYNLARSLRSRDGLRSRM